MIFIALLMFRQPILKPVLEVGVADNIYHLAALAVEGDRFYLLDEESGTLAIIDRRGTPIAKAGSKGQGPGEFVIPRAIASGDSKVFVSDYGKMVVHDASLNYLYSFPIPNNPRSMVYHKGLLYLGTTAFPDGKKGVHVYDVGGNAMGKFYDHGLDPAKLAMPMLTKDSDGRLFVLAAIGYSLSILDDQGNPIQPFTPKPSPLFKTYVPPEPFTKKYGLTMASYKKWMSNWSEPEACAIVEDQYLVLCFKNLAEDLITSEYFIEVYDLVQDKKIISWKQMPGPLRAGGGLAYFSEDAVSDSDYVDKIVGYKIESSN